MVKIYKYNKDFLIVKTSQSNENVLEDTYNTVCDFRSIKKQLWISQTFI